MINLMSLRQTKISWKLLAEKALAAFVALIHRMEIVEIILSTILQEMIPAIKMTMIIKASFRIEIRSIHDVGSKVIIY